MKHLFKRDWERAPHIRYPTNISDYFFSLRKRPFLDKETPIGSIGSCFSAYISKYLIKAGYNYIITEEPKYDTFSAQWGIVVSPACIAQIFRYSLTHKFAPLEEFWEVDGKQIDPYRSGFFYDKKEFLVHKANSKKALTKPKVFIITLGLTEVWRDKRDGSTFAVAPPKMEPYHELYVLNEHDVFSYLYEIWNLLSFYNPECKLILSVSPIPLTATFRKDVDVVTANGNSKATLRSAVGEFCKSYPQVEYFPSWEFVTFGMPNFLADNRHPAPEVVDTMMRFFLNLYSKDA
jgi:hypothetical protein